MLKPVDLVLIALIAVAVAFALRRVIGTARRGGCSCNGCQTGCTGEAGCPYCKAPER